MEEKRKSLKIYLPIILALVFIAGIFLGSKIVSNSSLTQGKGLLSFNNKYDKINDVFNYIQGSYVDSISKEKLTEEAITNLLEKLDPHSTYITAAEYNDANDPLQGSFEGIGVEFRIQRDSITVMNVVSGGPSEGIGVRAGDRIVKVDGKNVAGIKITNNDVMKKLKGKGGTKVKINVFRRGIKKLLEFNITRGVIPTYSLDIAYMLTSKIGYIKLSKFSATTHEEFVKALLNLKSKGMTKLVLDLRDNGGGYLQAAIDIADEFLPDNKLIVYTKGAHKPKTTVNSTKEGNFENGTLVILVNEFSASASEIVAGAIQDNDRGTIIGRKSFGKGLVQEQVKLYDGSAIRLTVARYYTPTGRCIQKSYSKGVEEYYNQFYEQFTDGELESPDSIKFADSLKFKTPKGKIVYGGGGIMPDVFVPLGKDENSKYFIQLFNKGIIFQYTFDYTDKNRQSIKSKYTNAEGFIKNFIVDETLFNDFIAYSEKNGIKKDEKGIAQSDKTIRTYIKAYIGRNIFRDECFYPILNKEDKMLKKTIELINGLK
ncbi:MAG: S41 family peptidase [Bacteroidetes bacterium]|nr:S41 family peptidase [Bacteroidota bacterium]